MARRPRIGVDLDHEHDGRRWIYKLSCSYLDALYSVGAEPVPISPGDPREAEEILEGLDGFLMTGGDDFHPHVLGQEAEGRPMTLLSVRRERFVLRLGKALLAGKTPCLAVCLGSQAIQVAAGASLYLDLESERQGCCEHKGGHFHRILPEPGGYLHRSWGGAAQDLRSHHHQAAKDLACGFRLEARAEDGVIEAFMSEEHPFLLAVQWHPEVQDEGPGGLPLIDALIRAAKERC